MRRRGGPGAVVYLATAATAVYVLLIARYASYSWQGGEDRAGGSGGCRQQAGPGQGNTPAPVSLGGRWRPADCSPPQRLAVIIPYRARAAQLALLLEALHPLLQHQRRHYTVFVVEQAFNDTFNKGLLMNVAAQQALEEHDCLIFHDVDMLPESLDNPYECGPQPRHLSPALDEMRYVLMYERLVGGVLALSRDQLHAVNGFSNLYWGWGAEDDDMAMRLLHSGYEISRPPNHQGRYKMLKHAKRERAPNRVQLLADWRRFPQDGLSSLPSVPFSILATSHQPLYTNLTVDVGSKPETPSAAAGEAGRQDGQPEPGVVYKWLQKQLFFWLMF